MSTKSQFGKILWIGWGDLAHKSKEAFSVIKQKGYEILALDVMENPVGLKSTEPEKLFLRTSEDHHKELVRIARQDGFDVVYVANYGHQHISSALEFQSFTPQIIVAKPLDTCLDFLLNVGRDQENFIHLLKKLFIHDHYLNKPGVVFLRDRMPELHSEHNFLDSIQLYLVERATIEEKEPHRREALECGMLFDLAVHMISVLQVIVPESMSWHDGQGRYQRLDRRINVTACNVAKDAGSILTKSTVIRGREAETFGVIELKVTEKISHESSVEFERDFPVLIVVGKGVPAEQGITRDLKAIFLKFRDEAEIALDIDTYGIRGIEDRILRGAGYANIEFTQRGINLPLVTTAQNGFNLLAENIPFQPPVSAFKSVHILWEALHLAPPRPTGYRAGFTTCSQLVNILLRQDSRFSDWGLPQNFGNFLIGTPPDHAIP